MITNPKGVRAQHPLYIKLAPVWKKARDAAEGERAIHAATTAYLPKLKEETDDDYKARLGRTGFFNAYWRTVSGLKGMLFRKAPQVVTPAAIESYLGDIDMAGTPLDMFVQHLSEELLTVGRVGVLVDHPPKPAEGGDTVAAAAAAGLRPMMQQYPAESIINWKVARVNNVMQLKLLVLKESVALALSTDYGHETDDRYRELSLMPEGYRQRVFAVKDEKDVQIGGDVFPLMNGKAMTEIPFTFYGVDSADADPDSPPLEDLMNLNLHHYQVSADYEHGCHFSGLPTFYISGYTPKEGATISVGGSTALCFDNPQAKAAYAEVEGTFTALVTNLDSKKSEMAVLGARMLENAKTAVESGETQRQRVAGEQSQLASMAQIMSMCVTRSLEIFAQWAGADGDVSYQVNRDFMPAGIDAADLTALVSSWQAGAISGQTLHANLQRGEIIEPDVSFEDEQERIATRAIPTPDLMLDA